MSEWQIWGNSSTAHLVEYATKRTKRSGIKANCGKYVGSGVGEPFFQLDENEDGALRAIRSYLASPCIECLQSDI